MTDAGGLDFGSLNEHLQRTDPAVNLQRSIDGEFARENPEIVADVARELERPHAGVNLMRSAGPISDRYIMSAAPIAVITGPQGSGKTVASVKKALVEAQRIRPGADGVRRYKLGVWRQKYDNLWKATIPSWWKILPKHLGVWTGASPRAARHVIRFRDRWGDIELTADFQAFGDIADPEDLKGLEFTDVWLNELDTLPEELFTWLKGRIGRDPPPEITGRHGRVIGDMNAPDVLNWTYRDVYERVADGLVHFRQPGGMHPDAENLAAYATPEDPSGRGYYEQQKKLNAANPWWIRRMVDAIPGVSRATDLVYPAFDEGTMLAPLPIVPEQALPVLVGVDGGLTPAAVYGQEMPNGQLRIIAEIALERGGMEELAAAMLALEARRFRGCEFRTVCDPAMKAGEDSDIDGAREQRVSHGSDRQRLAKALARKVDLAVSQEPTRRWDAVRVKIGLNLGPGKPGYWLDPSCKGLLRGKLQTYQFRKLRGTNDLSSVTPTFDTHVADAEQYLALECGTDAARKRLSDQIAARKALREQQSKRGRYNPLQRYRRR